MSNRYDLLSRTQKIYKDRDYEDVYHSMAKCQGKLPQQYRQLEYIESTGTQYIDTGIEVDGTLDTYLDFAFSSYDSNERYVFGLDSPTVVGMISGHGRIYEFGSERHSWTLDTERHTAIVGTRVIFDGVEIVSSIEGSHSSYNTFLFCSNTTGDAPYYYSESKLYACKMYLAGALVRDFVPCYRLSDGVTGLYDRVEHKFYVNQGTGSFVRGPDMPVENEMRLATIYGNSWVECQLLKNGDFALGTADWSGEYGTLSVADGVATVIADSDANTRGICQNVNTISGHKYLASTQILLPRQAGMRIVLSNGGNGDVLTKTIPANAWTSFDMIIPATGSWTKFYILDLYQGGVIQGGDAMKFKDIYLFDLTHEFGAGNEPTSILDRRVQKLLVEKRVSTVKTIRSTSVQTIEFHGMNLWDEEWEQGTVDGNGQPIASSTHIRSKNFTEVLGGESYHLGFFTHNADQWLNVWAYDQNKDVIFAIMINGSYRLENQTFTTPNNCRYIKMVEGTLTGGVSTYEHNICLSRVSDCNGTYAPARWQDFYQQVEYIESTGTQYIDTGLSMTSGFRAVGTFKPIGRGTSTYNSVMIIGAEAVEDGHWARNYGPWLPMNEEGTQATIGMGIGGAVRTAEYVCTIGTIYSFDISTVVGNVYLKLDGNDIDCNVVVDTITDYRTSRNLYIFADNHYDVSGGLKSALAIYGHFAIYDENNVLVRDFVPVYRKVDQEIGLYDIANNVFYPNAGTGTFLKGADVKMDNQIVLPAPLELDGFYDTHNTFEVTPTAYVITRRIARILDLSSLTWQDDGTYYVTTIDDMKPYTDSNHLSKRAICDNYFEETGMGQTSVNSFAIGGTGGRNIYIKTRETPTGKCYYELEIPQVISIPRHQLAAAPLNDLSWSGKYIESGIEQRIADLTKAGFVEARYPSYGDDVPNVFCANYLTVAPDDTDAKKRGVTIRRGSGRYVHIYDPNYNQTSGTNRIYAFRQSVNEYFLFYQSIKVYPMGDLDNLADSQFGGVIAAEEKYDEFEYIDALNIQTYVDTGIALPRGFRAQIKMEKITPLTSEGEDGIVIGAVTDNSSSSPKGSFFRIKKNGSSYVTFGVAYGDTLTTTPTSTLISPDLWTIDVSNVYGDRHLIVNGTSYALTASEQTDYGGQSLYLFGGHRVNSTTDSYEDTISMRLYYCRIWDENNVLVRDFVPCVRRSDQTNGLFDKVEGKFYRNYRNPERDLTPGNYVNVLDRNLALCDLKMQERR